jgi:hypothetical protein
MINNHEPITDNLLSALQVYLTARRNFIRYTLDLQRSQPLAVGKFEWTDYLKNDPAPAAVLCIADGQTDFSTERLPSLGWPEATEILEALRRTKDRARLTEDGGGRTDHGAISHDQGPLTNLVRNPGFVGPLRPARTIADLEYGAALPAEWTSRVEPAQHARVQLLDEGHPLPGEGRKAGSPNNQELVTNNSRAHTLRISGNKDVAILQWNPVVGNGLHRARVAVRGKVSPGAAVTLTFGWLDQKEQRLGFKVVRLPDGEWPDWVTLQQAGLPPRGAAWVGVGIRVQHQVPGDFVEAKDFSLLAGPAPAPK